MSSSPVVTPRQAAAPSCPPALAGTVPVGVLDLCRGTPGPLPLAAFEAATTCAAAASSLLEDDLAGALRFDPCPGS